MILEYNRDSRTRRWQTQNLKLEEGTNPDEVDEGVLVNLDKKIIPVLEFVTGDVFLASGGIRIYVLHAVLENHG